MRGIILGKNLKFLYLDREYQIIEMLKNDAFIAKDKYYGAEKRFTLEEIMKFIAEGTLTFGDIGKSTIAIKSTDGKEVINTDVKVNYYPDFSVLDEGKKKKASERFMAIQPLLTVDGPINEAVKIRVEELNSIGIEVSERTLYRWHKQFIESGGDIHSLVDNYQNCGVKETKLNAEVEAIIQKSIEQYINKEVTTLDQLKDYIFTQISSINMHRLEEAKLKFPSLDTIRRRVKGYDEREMKEKTLGKEHVRNNMRGKGKFIRPKRPLERVEADHTQLDIILVDEETRKVIGRPWLTYLVDVFSNMVLGFYIGFESPSYVSVMKALNHAISTKGYVKDIYVDIENHWEAYGIPEMLVVDNGKEFRSQHLDDACRELGIELVFTPRRTPTAKPHVERAFRTINTGLMHTLPGTTFSNVQERKKRGYDSEKEASLSLTDLVELVHTWLIDKFLQKPSKGINGGIPANIWRTGVKMYGPPPIPAKRYDISLCKLSYRKLQHTGIRFLKGDYQSDALQEYRSELLKREKDLSKVKFKFDPDDISKIYVFDVINAKYIDVPTISPQIKKGMSLALWNRQLQKFNDENKKYDEVGVAKAQARIQEKVEEKKQLTKKILKQNAILEQRNSDSIAFGKKEVEKEIEKIKVKNGAKIIELQNTKKWGNISGY